MNTPNPKVVKLNGVRLSFPNLFEPSQAKDAAGNSTGKPMYGAVFLLDKKTQAKQIAALQAAVDLAKKEKWQGKPVNLIGKSIRDGSEKAATDGYGDDVVFISARNKIRPGVVDRDLTPLTSADGKPYAGCYVNATVETWAQDNAYGKRVNFQLRNIQFLKDGEPFGEKPVPAEEEFEVVAEESVV